ncbi:hypothetical protein [Solwaraspora sp. WMMD792]|uniref:hypothetical protein n=1 Tax=Solwaraspora sp. WMMD792 TaxID=3016099 RepID=UPI002417E219|nr:hypothetical protein [Solwaraspora sp. WMMD792]MDG4772279.1 hypothetical protein [Solwaraspora sp. WMMD792]
MPSRPRKPLGAAASLLLVFCGVVAISCTLCLTAAVLEFRKDPLQQSGARVFADRAQRLSREVSLLPADDPPAGHVIRIVATVEGRERTELGLTGRVYLVDVHGDHGRVEAMFTEDVSSGGGWFYAEGEVTVCVRWDLHRKSTVYSDITARAVSCP